MGAGNRVERVHVAGQDVHPPEQPAGGVPDRSLGQLALGRKGDLGRQHAGHGSLTSKITLICPADSSAVTSAQAAEV